MKRPATLSDWIFRSYIVHGIVLFAITWVALYGLPQRAPERVRVCEFILQQQSEPNKEKTDKIALNSAKAHGQRDKTDDPGKIDGGTGGRRSFTHKMQARLGALASSRQDRRTAGSARQKMPAGSRRSYTSSRRSYASVPQHHSFFRKWLGRHLNPDRDTDNSDPSYAANASPDFGPYMNYLHRVLAKSWSPPGGQSGRCVKVLFDINRKGAISGLHIIRSCGNSTYDHAALQAVTQASPFHPLPAGAPTSVSIEYTFDYHVAHRG